MPTSTKEIAAEIWLSSREDSIVRWNIPALARTYGCAWGKIWAAFTLAEEEYDVYVARNPFCQAGIAYTALAPIRKRLMSDGYEIVPEEARDKYRH